MIFFLFFIFGEKGHIDIIRAMVVSSIKFFVGCQVLELRVFLI